MAAGLSGGTLPPFIGIRIKPLNTEFARRGIRTLDIFLTTVLDKTAGRLPDNFVVTLPKVETADQTATLANIFKALESKARPRPGDAENGDYDRNQTINHLRRRRNFNPKIVKAADGRCVAAHFGVYDYTAELGITAAYQDIRHQACDFARNIMQISLAGTGIRLSDGATNVLPVPPHRGDNVNAEQAAENRSVVRRAWKLHYDNCRNSLANGFYQGWDLHPAQLVARYSAVFAFFHEGAEPAAKRLAHFIEKAAQATLVGDVFDDAATGQGLLNYFLRAVNCGGMTEQEVLKQTGLTVGDLRSKSFTSISRNRRL